MSAKLLTVLAALMATSFGAPTSPDSLTKRNNNIQLISAGSISNHKYTAKFTNVGSQTQSCVCWLGTRFFQGQQAFSFTLSGNGGVAAITAEENTQGGCTCGVGSVPVTFIGEFAGTWLEFDFGSSRNAGWSGAAASALVAGKAGLNIPGLNVCSSGICSTINAGGTGNNAYIPGTENSDGIGLNVQPGPLHIDVTVAYAG